MQLQLMRCTAELIRANKSSYISGSWIADGTLKENTSIIKPVITIQKGTPPTKGKYNYMYIAEFGRYYFINDIVILNRNMWEIRARCDVLYSHLTDILNSKCIIDKTEEPAKANTYLNDGSFVMDSRKYNQVIQFPSGLSEGQNILICAGG